MSRDYIDFEPILFKSLYTKAACSWGSSPEQSGRWVGGVGGKGGWEGGRIPLYRCFSLRCWLAQKRQVLLESCNKKHFVCFDQRASTFEPPHFCTFRQKCGNPAPALIIFQESELKLDQDKSAETRLLHWWFSKNLSPNLTKTKVRKAGCCIDDFSRIWAQIGPTQKCGNPVFALMISEESELKFDQDKSAETRLLHWWFSKNLSLHLTKTKVRKAGAALMIF